MYAQRYQSGKLNPGSLGLSLGIVGGLVAAGMLSSTVIKTVIAPDDVLELVPVAPVTPPPPERKLKPEVETKVVTPTVIEPRVPVPTQTEQPIFRETPPGPVIDAGAIEGTGSAVIDPPKPPPPVLTRADIDARYARDFQPIYPPAEQRAGTEGVVSLRVLIGVDGRVKQVEKLASPSDSFWRVTEQRALSKWRFTPATRDGVPYETWKTMTVRFDIAE